MGLMPLFASKTNWNWVNSVNFVMQAADLSTIFLSMAAAAFVEMGPAQVSPEGPRYFGGTFISNQRPHTIEIRNWKRR
jgi:hypothetical protein